MWCRGVHRGQHNCKAETLIFILFAHAMQVITLQKKSGNMNAGKMNSKRKIDFLRAA
jgi:hypothetical protein